MGDPKTPLLTVVIACAVNVTGDLLLVAMLHMGATGAALATVAAQGVSVLAVSYTHLNTHGINSKILCKYAQKMNSKL